EPQPNQRRLESRRQPEWAAPQSSQYNAAALQPIQPRPLGRDPGLYRALTGRGWKNVAAHEDFGDFGRKRTSMTKRYNSSRRSCRETLDSYLRDDFTGRDGVRRSGRTG